MDERDLHKFNNIRYYVVTRRLFNKNLNAINILREIIDLFDLKPSKAVFESWLKINRAVGFDKYNKFSNSKLKFQLDESVSNNVIKIQFYSLCRYQVGENLESLYKELKEVFGSHAPSFYELNEWIKQCWKQNQDNNVTRDYSLSNLCQKMNDQVCDIIEIDDHDIKIIEETHDLITMDDDSTSLKEENKILNEKLSSTEQKISNYIKELNDLEASLTKEKESKAKEMEDLKNNYKNSLTFINDLMKQLENLNSKNKNETQFSSSLKENLEKELKEFKSENLYLKNQMEEMKRNFKFEKDILSQMNFELEQKLEFSLKKEIKHDEDLKTILEENNKLKLDNIKLKRKIHIIKNNREKKNDN